MRHELPIGKRFGRLVCTGYSGTKYKQERLFACKCDCGNDHIARGATLRNGEVQSCGCLKLESMRTRCITHGCAGGGKKTTEYKTWCWIKQRCLCKSNKKYKDYGGAGITIAPEWVNDFPAFLAHVGKRPEGGYSIDRIDNTKGYIPGNVRWANRETQMANRSNSLFINGVKLVDYAKESGIKYSTLYGRIWRERCRNN